MKIEAIIAIVTSCFAVIVSALSLVYSYVQNKKDRIQKVILDNRIKYMYEIREGFSQIIGLANAEAIKAAKSNSKILETFFNNLSTGYGKIKSYIKPFYAIDKELLQLLDDLYNCILNSLNSENIDEAKLSDCRDKFADKYLIYDWAYWKYVQKQKEGNYMNSDDSFDDVYYNFVADISQNNPD